VDFIVQGPRNKDGKYKVRWVGYGAKEDTWEPAHYLPPPPELLHNGSDSEGDDDPIASVLGFSR
jgi:hypothetical protein